MPPLSELPEQPSIQALGPAKASSAAGTQRARSQVRRALWFWHFWIGLLITPFFLIVVVTGGIYIFKAELEHQLYSDIVEAQERDVSDFWLDASRRAEFDGALHEVVRTAGDEWLPLTLELESGSGRLPAIFMRNMAITGQFSRLYFEPSQPRDARALPERDIFTISLALHRRLMVGTPGRFLVELTTAWSILTALLGVLIWWPRSWTSLRGVLWPRLGAKRYIVWRDVHAIGGVLVSLLLLLLAVTGLLYSVAWGSLYHGAAMASGQYDIMLDPPKSQLPSAAPESASITVMEALQRALDERIATDRISIHFPTAANATYVVESGHWIGPSVTQLVHIDQYSGAIVKSTKLQELGWMAQWTQWNYPLHVGSILGGLSKWLWLIGCVLLSILPISGVVMFLLRRKPGVSPFPKYYALPATAGWYSVLALFGIALPLVGMCLLAIVVFRAVVFQQPVRGRRLPISPQR